MSTAPIIELRNVAVRRNGRVILDIEALDIQAGAHVAIIGPNGAGKSTLVQVLAQEVHPLWNPLLRCRLFGRDRWNVFELRSRMGIVSESMQQLCDTNHPACDIVVSALLSSIGLDFHHQVTDSMRQMALDALQEQGVLHLAHKPMRSLSSGEARRVLLARAAILDPEVLLLDEAVSNLDFPAKQAFRSALHDFHAKGKTLVLVTHDLSDIIEEIDRVVVLSQGKILADGKKAEVLTETVLSDAYGTRVFVSEREGRFTAWC